jgi:Fic family protein
LLQKVRFEGNWEAWLTFFFTAVLETAQQAVTTSHDVLRLFQRDRARIEKLGRIRGSTILVYGLLEKPYLTISTTSKDLRLSQPAVTNAMRALQKLEIFRENSGRNWNKIFVYLKYLRIMTEGAELSAE